VLAHKLERTSVTPWPGVPSSCSGPSGCEIRQTASNLADRQSAASSGPVEHHQSASIQRGGQCGPTVSVLDWVKSTIFRHVQTACRDQPSTFQGIKQRRVVGRRQVDEQFQRNRRMSELDVTGQVVSSTSSLSSGVGSRRGASSFSNLQGEEQPAPP
jgi:hypothetical protein